MLENESKAPSCSVVPVGGSSVMHPPDHGGGTTNPPLVDQDAEGDVEVKDGAGRISPLQAAAMFLAIFTPNAILLGAFSPIGVGITLYNTVSPKSMNLAGLALIAFACVTLALFYIFSWDQWAAGKRKFSLLIPGFGITAGSILVGRSYPWAPIVMVMFLIPFFCGILRGSICKDTKRSSFYTCFFTCTLICALLLASTWIAWMLLGDNKWDTDTKFQMAQDTEDVWKSFAQVDDPILGKRYLNYTTDCGPDKNVSHFSGEDKTDIGTNCKKSMTVLFTCWSSPMIAGVANLALGVFAEFSGVKYTLKGSTDVARLESMMKRFLGLLALVFMGMYFSVSMAGASIQLGSTFMAFFAAVLCILVIAMYIEIGPENMRGHLRKSKLTEMLLKAWHSDWARAMFIGAFNIFLPIFFILNMLRQKVNICRGNLDRDKFTPLGRQLVEEFKKWNWAGILLKICLLGELFFTFQVGVAKATYVFLSGLNKWLQRYSYGVVIGIIFSIGYTMFLLPPVPGVPVYVFCGIVVAEQGRQLDSIGFAGGCIIACLLAWVLKLAASTGQYMIGYFAGQSLYVQSLIGVDKVFTRAIEQVLKVPGLSVGKVAVLVGGPDWPTSVTCGILKLNIPQMLIGTAPVFAVSTPCVLAGAFLAQVKAGEDSIESALANTFMGLMGVGQMGCGFLAVATITKVIETDGAELAKPRAAHEAVAALTARQMEFTKIYDEVTNWSTMAMWRKITISTAASAQVLSGFLFAMGGEYCFRSFSVSSEIDAQYDEYGLAEPGEEYGHPWNIVLPLGKVGMALFAFGTVLHIFFAKDTGRLAKNRVAALEKS